MSKIYGSRFLCQLLILFIWLILPGSAVAASYWVSPDGQALWPACQSATPLNGPAGCSIMTANKSAVAGDTVYLRGGIYTGDNFVAPSNSGVAGSPITFSAYNQEEVLVNSQRAPNGDHESAAWHSWNGANIERSSNEAFEGTYSTKFSSTSQGQGIRSDVFTLPREEAGLGYYYKIWVYSDQASVNIQLRSADGSSVPLDRLYTLFPNQWNTFAGYVLTSRPDQFYLVVSSTPESPSGTWYVDDVRINAYKAAIYLNGKDHIVVRGIKVVEGIKGFDLRNGSDYNEISHSEFSEMNNNAYIINQVWDGNVSPSRYNWIHNCTFSKSGYAVRGAGGTTDCDDSKTLFTIGNNTGTDESSYNLIENNLFYHGGHDLVIVRTQFNSFRNNILHNEGWMLNREGPCQDVDGDPTTFNNPSKFGNRGLLFENSKNKGGYNLVEGNRIGFSGTPPDDDGANGIENPSDGNIFRYNLLFKNGGAGFYFKAQAGVWGVDVLPDNNVIYHNTIYKNGGGQDIDPARQAGLYFVCGESYTPTYPKGNVIKNNIVYDNSKTVGRITCEGYEYISNFEQDPLFVNPVVSDPYSATLPNLNLQSGSPAIDGAAALTTVKNGDAGTGTTLTVEDARYFQDGSWGPPGKVAPDVISIGRTDNSAKIVSIDYANNLIVLAKSLTRKAGDSVWLSRKSDGTEVLFGAGPDFGASEFKSAVYGAPRNLDVQ